MGASAPVELTRNHAPSGNALTASSFLSRTSCDGTNMSEPSSGKKTHAIGTQNAAAATLKISPSVSPTRYHSSPPSVALPRWSAISFLSRTSGLTSSHVRATSTRSCSPRGAA